MKIFSMRVGDLEVRTCSQSLTGASPHTRAELVHAASGTNVTLAAWTKTTSGYELRFVGDRPFRYADPDVMFRICKVCQEHLDNESFKSEDDT